MSPSPPSGRVLGAAPEVICQCGASAAAGAAPATASSTTAAMTTPMPPTPMSLSLIMISIPLTSRPAGQALFRFELFRLWLGRESFPRLGFAPAPLALLLLLARLQRLCKLPHSR